MPDQRSPLPSEYDPAFGASRPLGDDSDLEHARRLFAAASRPYLSSPIPWLAWAVVLPGAALATEWALAARGPVAVLALWSAAVLAGGAVEAAYLLRARRRLGTTPLGSWAMTAQGNLSLVAAALSLALVVADRADLVPGIWLLLLGHSLFTLGGLALPAMRSAGIVYQLAGAAALVPGVPTLPAVALATGAGNLWIAIGLLRSRAAVSAGPGVDAPTERMG
jgi:hypothetical protein